MKKKIYFSLGGLIILIILGLLFLFPQKIEHSMKKSISSHTITKQDNGKEFSVNVGDSIQIELEENGTTGYVWQIDNLDKKYFELVLEDTRNTTRDNKIVGTPVIGIWQIKTLRKGSASIKMNYFRSWEGKESTIDHFAVDLRIK
jgi:inhibitor of cysteine peptidase